MSCGTVMVERVKPDNQCEAVARKAASTGGHLGDRLRIAGAGLNAHGLLLQLSRLLVQFWLYLCIFVRPQKYFNATTMVTLMIFIVF